MEMISFPHFSYILPYVFVRSGQSTEKLFKILIFDFIISKVCKNVHNNLNFFIKRSAAVVSVFNITK
jgi:membrane protein CcdC involved in cytochrome C biogenesis